MSTPQVGDVVSDGGHVGIIFEKRSTTADAVPLDQ